MSDDTFAVLSKRLDKLTQQAATAQAVNRWGMPSKALTVPGRAATRPKYTAARAESILEAVGLGAGYEAAAAAAGISEKTLRVWMRRQPAFAVALKTAASTGMHGTIVRTLPVPPDRY